MTASTTRKYKFFGLVPALGSAAVSLMTQVAYAGGKGHAAHEHGVAKVSVVAEGMTLTIQLEAPSESIYGFEHEAKKPSDVKKRDEAVEKLKTNADKIFLLDTSLECKVANTDVKAFVTEDKADDKENKKHSKKHKAGTHSEVHATFKFECGKPVAGSTMKFAARSQFKALRTLNVQVLSGDKQAGSTIKNDKGEIQL
jgi:hypothetical protein